MLKKLFYNDFHGIRRHALPFLLSALGCGVASLFIVLLDAVLPKEGDLALFLANSLTALLGILLLVFIVLLILASLQIFSHYYRNFFTDEGYLTFMLPATREQLLVSKILAGITWSIIIVLVAAVSVTVGILIPVEVLMQAENASFLSSFLRSFTEIFSLFELFEYLITLLSQTIFIYTAITMGSLFFAKRKMLGSFVFYFVLSGVVSFLQGVFTYLILSVTEDGEIFTSLSSILISVVISIGGYLIIRALLKRNLNLV